MTLGRRALLAAGLAAVAACGRDEPRGREDGQVPPERLTYGEHPAQWGELHPPAGRSRGVVVVIHGGFWKAAYDASLGTPLAVDLAARGWTAWNLEYRRVGDGGGWPETFDDVAAGIDRLAEVDGLDLSTVITLGHSAGGHLALWAAARARFGRWSPTRVPVAAAVPQAGVLDLTRAHELGLGAGAVEAFLGAPPGPSYERVDPQRQLPLDVPVRCVHGVADDIVPFELSARYVGAARAAGGDAELVEVAGDHFVVIDPSTDAWARTVEVLDALRVAP